MDIWEKLPEWLRWILYLPLILIVLFISNLIFAFVNKDIISKPDTVIWVLSGAMQSFISAGIFIYLSINLAPRAKKLSGFVLYLVYSLIFIAGTYYGIKFLLKEGMSYQLAFEFSQSIVWFAVGYWAFTTNAFIETNTSQVNETQADSEEDKMMEQEYGHIIDNEYSDDWVDLPRKQRLIKAKEHIEEMAQDISDRIF